MVIYGYSFARFPPNQGDFLDIADPIYGKSHVPYLQFRSDYQGSGTWTDTYYTKSGAPIMRIKPFSHPYVRFSGTMDSLRQDVTG